MKNIKSEERKRCDICGRYFRVDRRVGHRQRCCKHPKCQRELRVRRDRKWRADNPDYFQGRYNDTKQWRERNPGYQARWRAKRRGEIQAEIRAKSNVRSSFVALGFGFGRQNGEIQVQIPPGISVRRVNSAAGVLR